jgi:hypothetical protein
MNDGRLLARITAVEPLDGFRLRLTFTDGLVREVDLSSDLWGSMADVLHGDHEAVGRPAAQASH